MKGASIKVLLDIALESTNASAKSACEVLKTQVFLTKLIWNG